MRKLIFIAMILLMSCTEETEVCECTVTYYELQTSRNWKGQTRVIEVELSQEVLTCDEIDNIDSMVLHRVENCIEY